MPLIIYDVHLLMYIAFCDIEFLLLNMVSTKKLFGERVITLEDHVVLQSSSSGISKTKTGNCNRSYDIFQSCRVSPIGNDIGWKIWFQGILTSLTDASQNVLSYIGIHGDGYFRLRPIFIFTLICSVDDG